MVELLAAIGFGAKELFSYNRESYKFDQDQRLEREMLRLEMQVKRFELFREDVRDLVELTVGRMDVYHLVGALFLEFCVSFFCEGRVQANAPPFILALFLLSNACAFVYLLLAVWLSMHASIASHSFGVRLLTRFVRLPIPSPSQIASISSRLADFEAQGVQNMLRLPVLHEGNAWQLPPQDEASAAGTAAGGAATNDTSAERPRALAPSPPGLSQAASAAGAQAASATADTQAATARSNGNGGSPARPETLLGSGEVPFAGEEAMLRSAAVPGLHVQLFRRLQAKWQCYDAYCRVCMALGVNQILQGLTYYAIVHTLVENRSPSCGYALLVVFQSAALAVAVLDISGLRRRALLAVQAVGTLPATLAALAVHSAERAEDGALDPGEVYYTAPAMFFLQACWLELLLWVAQPSNDDAALPRRFRTVLFLDVFGDGIDPTDAEHRPNPLTPDPVQEQERLLVAERVAAAEASLSVATAALRRWEAAPASLLSEGQHAELQGARVELQVWRRALRGELAWRAATRGMPHDVSYFGEDTIRPWGELSQVEQAEDPFRGCLIGPFEHDMGYETSTYYYDVERVSYVWDAPGAAGVLRLASVTSAVRGLEAALRLLLAMSEGATSEDPAQFDELEIPVRSSTLADIDMVMRGFLSLPRRLIHFGRSRLMNTFADAVPGIELSTPLVQRAVSGGSTEGGQTRVPHHQLAGPFAKHFVPERLPWQVLRGVTRVLQLSWGFVGMMAVLRELGIYRIDYQQHPGDRRLAERPSKPACDPQEAAEWLDFEPLEVTFPHGPFFEAEALSWLGPKSASSSSSSVPNPTGALLLGSPFANYRLEPATEGGMKRLEPRPLSAAAPGAVAMGPFLAWATQDSSISFAVAEASSNCPGRGETGAVATLGLAATRGESRTWRYLAGTHLPCWLLETEALSRGPRTEHRCLALAGYDGRRVVVAWTPWQDPCTAPAEAMLRPRFAVPLAEGAVPMALSLRRHGTSSVRLLCLQSDGSIRIWELHGDQVSKDFRTRWPLEVQSDFQALGVAEDIANALLYVTGYGRNGSGSRLLRARLPDVFSGNRSLAT